MLHWEGEKGNEEVRWVKYRLRKRKYNEMKAETYRVRWVCCRMFEKYKCDSMGSKIVNCVLYDLYGTNRLDECMCASHT